MLTNLYIIDDDEEILKLLNLALTKAGFKVETANNYVEALSKIDKEYTPDLIIMDYYLPEVDGISLAKEFLKKGIKSPVFLFTAADSDIINLSNCPENIIDIIRKPFSFDDIINKIYQTQRYDRLYSKPEDEKISNNERINIDNEFYTKRIVDIQKFLDKVSHKVKNSLQTITNYVELLKKRYIDEEEKDRVFQTILDKVNQIKYELDVLKRPAEFYCEENFSFKNVIKTSLSLLKNDIKSKDIYVKSEFQKHIPLYYGRRGIFVEFFTEFFSKIISCTDKAGRIVVTLSQENEEFVVTVIQDKISKICQDLYNFFELSLKEEKEIRFTKTFIDFKNMGGRVIIDKDIYGKGLYKIIVPKNVNVSNRD